MESRVIPIQVSLGMSLVDRTLTRWEGELPVPTFSGRHTAQNEVPGDIAVSPRGSSERAALRAGRLRPHSPCASVGASGSARPSGT